MSKVFLLFLFLAIGVSSKSQYFDEFAAMASIGLTSSQISGDGNRGFYQFGFRGGFGLGMNIREPFRFESGVYFNQKGARRYAFDKSDLSTYRLRVNYLEFPFLVTYLYDDFLFKAGPSFNLRLNQREITEFGQDQDPHLFKPYNWGLILSSGLSIDGWSGIYLNFQHSMTPARDHKGIQGIEATNFIIKEWYQKMLIKGQYFSSLSLVFRIQI